MSLASLLLREGRAPLQRFGVLATVAAGASASALAIINRAALAVGRPGGEQSQPGLVALLAIVLVVYVLTQGRALRTSAQTVEGIVHGYRERLITKLRLCELPDAERIGRGQIIAAISSDTLTIAQCAGSVTLAAQALLMLGLTSLYLISVSMAAFVLTAAVLTVAGWAYWRRAPMVRDALRRAHEHGGQLHGLVSGLLEGFKEIKLSDARAADAVADAAQASARTAENRIMAQQALASNFIFAQTSFFLLLGAIAFLMPALEPSYASDVVTSVAAVMFLIGPISGVIGALPQIAVANAAADNLQHIDRLLDASTRERAGQAAGEAPPPAAPGSLAVPRRFDTIELRSACYTHRNGEDAFAVGPIDLQVRHGELVFITGGNGSGKTTMLKLLTALYPPSSGLLLLDGRPVDATGPQAYRNLFAAVFSDFHLFHRLYGVRDIDPAVVRRWIERLELGGKVRIEGDRFSTTSLSAGQRKRLALLSALLERKPILVLDEWAADQDPHFRAVFYEELLPEIRAEGRTIIAITHDDRYFHCADRRLHMESGHLREMPLQTA